MYVLFRYGIQNVLHCNNNNSNNTNEDDSNSNQSAVYLSRAARDR